MILFILFLTSIAALFGLCTHIWWQRRSLPPGQFPLPLLGNFVDMVWNSPGYKTFEKYKKNYGPVYTFWFGPGPLVCIADYDLLKETFIKDGDSYTQKKILQKFNDFMRGGNYGIVDSNGEVWREHRRFALHQLRDLGLGKMKMEERILDEIPDLWKKFDEQQGSEVQVHRTFRRAVANVINQVLFGYSFRGIHEQKYDRLNKMFIDLEKLFGNPLVFIVIMFPFLQFLPVLGKWWNGLVQFRDVTFEFFEEQIKEHESEINFDNSYSTDYVEAYLKEKRNRELEGDTESFSYMQLRSMCFDLWVAAFETTSATAAWMIAYLVNHPDVQTKMQNEMDQYNCKGRLITMADKSNLIYSQAVVNESQRLANVIPLNLPHKVDKDVVIGGYKIAKDTGVVAQISSLLYDPEVFPDPHSFKPDRFIDDEQKIRKYDQFLPFSIGKRACPGEGLARMELFLFIANIINKYTILPDGNPPSLVRSKKNMQMPEKFRYLLEKRF